MGIAAILLCGGRGTRMIVGGEHTHKPLLEVGGVPATKFVAKKLQDGFSFSQTLIVVPSGRENEYKMAMQGIDCQIITQHLPLGTGNAVYESLKFLDRDIEDVYVSFGTQPLIRNETVQGCLNVHKEINSDFTLATVVMDCPYAPLIRDNFGNVTESLETHLDGANMPSRGETNVGSYWASRNALQDILVKLHQDLYSEKMGKYDTISGELGYPNEMVKGCIQMGLKVEGVCIADEQEMLGIKTPETLTAIREIVDGYL
tara:strand:- start:378 stop:1154 length:777 start_codon:yes stop_codon:yes gene_type:complete